MTKRLLLNVHLISGEYLLDHLWVEVSKSLEKIPYGTDITFTANARMYAKNIFYADDSSREMNPFIPPTTDYQLSWIREVRPFSPDTDPYKDYRLSRYQRRSRMIEKIEVACLDCLSGICGMCFGIGCECCCMTGYCLSCDGLGVYVIEGESEEEGE